MLGGRQPDQGGRGPGRAGEAGEPPTLLGDVVVCPAVASRQAPEHGATLDDELALLVVHGVLHLLNYDHADPREEATMQRRERELLARFREQRAGAGAPTPADHEREPDAVSGADWAIVVAIIVLFLFSIVLAAGRDRVHPDEPHPRALARGGGPQARAPAGADARAPGADAQRAAAADPRRAR